MPELPEVETSRRGIEPHILGHNIDQVQVHEHRLRWPIPHDLPERLIGQPIQAVDRRGKYLLLRLPRGGLILHLGMSGNLRLVAQDCAPQRHDHLDIGINGHWLRLHDPRRFGAALWADHPMEDHPLLVSLGPEPLGTDFSADYLYERSRGRRSPVKTFIMDSKMLVGVGNIYANESLFRAGIHPATPCGTIGMKRYQRLVESIRLILEQAIQAGGTTLKDFIREDGRPGYFAQELQVYDRAGLPCPQCGSTIRSIRLGQRSTFYCRRCQR
jgi:formamidopyrimidine-DNA glycosylase